MDSVYAHYLPPNMCLCGTAVVISHLPSRNGVGFAGDPKMPVMTLGGAACDLFSSNVNMC